MAFDAKYKKPSQAIRSLRRRWQGQPILRTGKIIVSMSTGMVEAVSLLLMQNDIIKFYVRLIQTIPYFV